MKRFVNAFDCYLAKYDIEGSIAHTKMLAKNKIISLTDAKKIIAGLNRINQEITQGKFKFDAEDIHTGIEKRLIEIIGAVGGKLHTARSRNDQVVLDEKLYLRDQIKHIIKLVTDFQKVLVNVAEQNIETIMPGFTHLQPAQPVSFAQHILAYSWMLERDKSRYQDCLKRVNICPLGAAALAGTEFPIDRNYTAKLLGFDKVTDNSMDTVSDRDFVIEFISASAILIMHLSRLAEEIIIWSTPQFGFMKLADEFTTGSSIMPQKKNPDYAELVRGKTGRVYGNLISVLTVMKGLPLAYNRDMQEDKLPLYDTAETIKDSLSVTTAMFDTMQINKTKLKLSCKQGYLEATELADYLVSKGLPFRQSHRITKKIVEYCMSKGKLLTELDIGELKQFSGLFKPDVFQRLELQSIVQGKKSFGGTSFQSVRYQIKELRKLVR